MGKKRRKRSARKSQRYDSHQRKGGSHSRSLGFVLREKLLRHLWLAKTPPTINHLVKELQLPRGAKSTLTPLLDDLLGQKIIRLAGRRGYELNRQLLLCEGVFEQNPKGFGFINRLDCGGKKQTFSRDPMLSASRVGSARQGDRVLIHIYNVRRDGRPEARLLTVLERQHKTLGGFVKLSKGHCDVTPEDPRFPFTIRIDGPCEGKMKNGDAVIVRLEEENDHSPLLQGSIIEYLGDPEQIDVQMRLVIEKFNLPAVFSDEALAESEHLSTKIEPEDGRADLRDIGHVTIDGETAKDFDDAVAVIKTRKGYRLYVSIADVSHYVHPGSGLDEDAHQRGTSIYFPGRVIPMLPEKLSNNLCSLVPGEDRFTVSAILDFDRQGNRLKKQFTKSIIHSHQRFTYTTVREILIDKNPEVRRAHKEFLTPLKWAEELARQLTQKRRERGSIGFTLPEPDIRLDEEGKIASITRAERNFAHQLIEEFMLAANEAVAETFTEEKKKGLYRIHEKPNQEKIREFTAFGAGLGLQLPPLRQDPDWFGQVLDLVKDSPKEYVVNNLLLRTMQQARYDTANAGHFGLAATDYTHFTSPIRRYPDLLVHRSLKQLLGDRSKQVRTGGLTEDGVFLSARERVAVNSERDMGDRLKRIYMAERIGEQFQAIISGINEYAVFVELLDLFISGSVALSRMEDDYYHYNSQQHRLEGETTGRIYQLGDLIHVVCVEIDRQRGRISFDIVDSPPSDTSSR